MIKSRRKFKTTIQELKFDPVLLYQNFRTSTGELEGTAPSTGSAFAEELDISFFLCDVIDHLNIISVGQRSRIHFFAFFSPQTLAVGVNGLIDSNGF